MAGSSRCSVPTATCGAARASAVHAIYTGCREARLRLGVGLHEFKPLTGESRNLSLLESRRASPEQLTTRALSWLPIGWRV